MLTVRLSGLPAGTPVSAKVALRNSTGLGAFSAAKVATPGAAAGGAPELWGAIAHSTSRLANPYDVSAWSLDNATEEALDAASPYLAPRRVIATDFFGRKNTTTEVLTVGVGYPFVAMVKAGTSGAARIVIRHEATGGEARLLTTGFTEGTIHYTAPAPGTISTVAIAALDDGYIRMSGVFWPSIAAAFLWGVGPNDFTGASVNVEVYGGDLASPVPPDPEPDPDTVPVRVTSDQWSLRDAATDGETLIIDWDDLPADGGQALTELNYRVNGGPSLALPAVAPGSYQITVPATTLASITVHASNALGAGPDSAAEEETPSVAGALDPDGSDAATVSNAIWTGKAALDPDAGQIILLGATTLAGSGETYINGVRLFNGDGSQWHVRRWGDLQYVPNGAHDGLNSDESTVVSVAWRRTGDVVDRNFDLRVYGSQRTGNDLARGVTPGTSMTLTAPAGAGEVLEVIFTAGASACTPAIGGVAGRACPAGKRDVQYLRVPAGGSAALTFTTTPSAVHAREVLTPGNAAAIRRIKASRSGTTLSLDWRTMPRAGLPDTAGWTELGGTPASPVVIDASVSEAGLDITGTYLEWQRLTGGAGQSVFVHDFHISRVNSTVKIKDGFANVLVYDGESYGPQASGKLTSANFIKPLENLSTWPDSGNFWCYDTVFDWNATATSGNNESIDGDAYIRNMNIEVHFMNGDWRDTGDAIADMKGRACFNAMTFGQSQRAIRAWHHPTLYGRARLDGPYSQAVVNQSERGGIVALWMVDQPGGLRVRDYLDVPQSLGTSAFQYVADARQLIVMRAKPAFDAACDYAATDFEFEQSLDGGVSWSALTVTRTGPNDCWGATRRTIAGISASITHVRARALWGAKTGAWTQTEVTV